jgi:hypothetical protein
MQVTFADKQRRKTMAMTTNKKDFDCPSDTPWGWAQDKKVYADGVVFLSTSSHGGFWVSKARLLDMPECLRYKTFAGECWFEEDEDWALVGLAFPALFDEYHKFQSLCTLRSGHKDRFEQFKETQAGKEIIAECDEYLRVNAKRFQSGSSGTGSQPGRCWNSGLSMDGKIRITWEEESPRDFRTSTYLQVPYTLEEAQSRAIPGTFTFESR